LFSLSLSLPLFSSKQENKMPLCGKNEIKTTNRKLVVCGDGACGKTSLLNVFTRDYFPQVCFIIMQNLIVATFY
jgi:ABC-type taurine transport system ATPase subunit